MTYLNQSQILIAMDMLLSITAFIASQMELPKDQQNIKDYKVDPERVDPKQHRKTLTNILRQQILRIQPYLTPQT